LLAEDTCVFSIMKLLPLLLHDAHCLRQKSNLLFLILNNPVVDMPVSFSMKGNKLWMTIAPHTCAQNFLSLVHIRCKSKKLVDLLTASIMHPKCILTCAHALIPEIRMESKWLPCMPKKEKVSDSFQMWDLHDDWWKLCFSMVWNAPHRNLHVVLRLCQPWLFFSGGSFITIVGPMNINEQ